MPATWVCRKLKLMGGTQRKNCNNFRDSATKIQKYTTRLKFGIKERACSRRLISFSSSEALDKVLSHLSQQRAFS
jgi:hypothetical protein